MKFAYVSFAIAALVGTAAAQNLAGLPTCAQDCVNNALPKNCNLLDIRCICTSKTFLTDISCCVSKACSPADQKNTIQFADNICGSSGVTNLPQSATCASSAESTATGAAGATSSSGSTTTVATTTVTGTVTSSAASSTGAAASGSSASSSASASAASPSASKAGAPVSGPNVAAAGVLAAFALFA